MEQALAGFLARFPEYGRTSAIKSAGAIRVSFGLVSTFSDAFRVQTFAAGLRDQTRLAIGDVSFDVASCRVMRDGS